MDAVIDARFERVEKALAALIDSIAKYNPSLQVGNDLIAAEEELQDGLAQVQRHQENHVHIKNLRDASTALDNQIRGTLVTLSTTRKEMTTTPGTIFPDRQPNEISFDELLSYARRISKTTLPPAGVTNGVAAPPPNDDDQSQQQNQLLSSAAPSAAATPNGTAPPTPAPTSALTPQPQQQTQTTTASAAASPPSQPAANVLPQDWSNWLNPHTGTLFIPWPQDNQIRIGALSANEILAERGVVIKGFDPVEEERRAAEAAAEAKRREEELAEAERVAMAEREAQARAEMERRREAREREQREALRRGSTALDAGAAASAGLASPTSASPAVKKQFQFMGDDDDDDDSD
ncbi:hypothetical protein PspLS_09461 [Pyricularia sp. CBS 133598]|nr:hypothetical protein PspLS_09461 [Pyricularia sp. CBS 133598]